MRRFLTLLVSLLMLTAAACGDDNPSGATTNDSINNTAPDITDDTAPDTEPEDTLNEDIAEDAPAPEDVPQEQDVAQEDTPDEPDLPPVEGPWSSAAPITAGPRQEVSVVALGGEMYVIGGFNEALQIVPTVEVYDPATDTWRSIAPMPQRMHHANAAAVDGKLYVVGFLTGRGFTPDGRGFVYDPATDIWDAIAPMPAGSERGASGTAAIDGKIYVAGGLRGDAVTDFSVYDPQADAWSALPELPLPLDHLVVGAINGTFYTFGGRDRSIQSHTERVFAFNPAQNQWEEKAPMPTSRAGHAAAVIGNLAYVLGGEGNPDDPTGVFDQNEAYDATNDTWTSLPVIPTRRHGTGAAAIDGKIYLPGGADVIAFGAIDVHEVFSP